MTADSLIDESAFNLAMGEEVEDMPHDFDSLEDWARDFLAAYLVQKPPQKRPHPVASTPDSSAVERVKAAIQPHVRSWYWKEDPDEPRAEWAAKAAIAAMAPSEIPGIIPAREENAEKRETEPESSRSGIPIARTGLYISQGPMRPIDDEQPDDWRPPCPDIEPIRKLAREVGYAIGEHGSKIRDYDLIAAPWTDDAVAYNVLIEHLCKGLNANLIDGPTGKPLGRRSCCIQIKDRYLKHIDLSIMPRGHERESGEQVLAKAILEKVAAFLKGDMDAGGTIAQIDNLALAAVGQQGRRGPSHE